MLVILSLLQYQRYLHKCLANIVLIVTLAAKYQCGEQFGFQLKWIIWFAFIIIIIMSCRQHGYPWPSLATFPYRSLSPAGLLGYILCPHIAAVCKFGLVVLLLLGHMWGSIVVRHLRARLCFSSSVRRVWLVWPV